MKWITRYEVKPEWATTLIWVWVCLNVLDYITTVVGIQNGLNEGNPLVIPFAANPLSLAGLKIFGALFVIFWAQKFKLWEMFKLLVLFLWIVCAWNLLCLLTVIPEG